jgi:hypothetical protein
LPSFVCSFVQAKNTKLGGQFCWQICKTKLKTKIMVLILFLMLVRLILAVEQKQNQNKNKNKPNCAFSFVL